MQPSSPDNGGWALQLTGQDANDTGAHDDFKSICAIPGGGTTPSGDTWREDQIYTVVERVIDGNTVTTIELFTPVDWQDPNYCWFVDCSGEGSTYQPGVAEIVLPAVVGDYTEYFVGFGAQTGINIIVKANANSTIDTTWGTNGYWGYQGPSQATTIANSILQVEDGRILVAHNDFYVSGSAPTGNRAVLAMLDTDGTLDTTWGSSGWYFSPYGTAGLNEVSRVLEDADGNFHLFGTSNLNGYTYVKLDSTGTYVTGLIGNSTALWHFGDAVWADDAKTRIIAVGIASTIAGHSANIMAVDPATGTRDTTWAGNVSYAGFALTPGSDQLYGVNLLSDGGFVVYRNQVNNLAKMLSDGSGLDTSWGTNGQINFGSTSFGIEQANNPTQDGDDIYLLTVRTTGGLTYNDLWHIDSTGTVVDTLIIGPVNGANYHMIQVMNDKLMMGTSSAAPANFNIETWTQGFVYESGFDVTNLQYVHWLIGDETTRDSDPGGTIPAVPEAWGTSDVNALDGASVCVYADAAPRGTFTMDGNDILGFTEADYSVVIAGLNYWSKLETMPLVVAPEPNAIIADKQIMAIRFDFDNTYSLRYGMGDDSTPQSWTFNGINSSVFKLERGTFPYGSRKKATVYIDVWDPVPLGIRAVIPEVTYWLQK